MGFQPVSPGSRIDSYWDIVRKWEGGLHRFGDSGNQDIHFVFMEIEDEFIMNL